MEIKFKHIIHFNEVTNTLFITGDITEELSTQVVEKLKQIDFTHRVILGYKLTIRLRTNGGCLFSGFSIYDCLKSLLIPTEIIVDGFSASAGTLIMLGATKVSMTPNSFIMIHELLSGYFTRYNDLKNYSLFCDKLMNRMLEIYNNKLKKPIKKEFLQKDVYLDAKEALKLGLIDAIV